MAASDPTPLRVAVVGGGWAGLAAAVQATRRGHQVAVFEAARDLGGRARSVDFTLPDGRPVRLDNGQHILIGAYTATLELMHAVGVPMAQALHRMPLTILDPQGQGLALPHLPAPWDVVVGVLRAQGWSWADRFSLLRVAARWQRAGFTCPPATTVADLGAGLTPRVWRFLIEPLCVSALNTPAAQASGAVFLRVLRDSLFAARGGSHLLIARRSVGALLPDAAQTWLRAHGGRVTTGQRVAELVPQDRGWWVAGDAFDAVVLAVPPWEAARLVAPLNPDWAHVASALRHEAITTVYAHAPGARLAQPLLALAAGPAAPAQFVFDRGQLDAPAGVLAFVVSASQGERAAVQEQVLAQGRAQLGLPGLRPIGTVVEKRATFACTPGLQRPPAEVAPGLWACGDHVDGPYPATLEGAVRSGWAAADRLTARPQGLRGPATLPA